jgi:hypothetical protein
MSTTAPPIPGPKPPVTFSSPESANTVTLSTTAVGPSSSTFITSTISSAAATSTHTPYSQPQPDPYHLNAANYIVVPVIGMVAILLAGSWYFIRRRRLILKQKRIAKEESAMTIAEKEVSRQRRRDKMRNQGNKDDAAIRGTT